jgi:hypothetical protein
MKPSPHGHSYVVRCTLKAFLALPDETPAEIGGCSKAMIVDTPVVRRRESCSPGVCTTHYPVIFTDSENPMSKSPTVALSIMQPWAWLIVTGRKDIENRSWHTSRRGPIFVHAGLKIDRDAHNDLIHGHHPVTGEQDHALGEAYLAAIDAGEIHKGGIVGQVEIVDCVCNSASDWFVGDFGFVLANAAALPFRPLKGALQFFKVES